MVIMQNIFQAETNRILDFGWLHRSTALNNETIMKLTLQPVRVFESQCFSFLFLLSNQF